MTRQRHNCGLMPRLVAGCPRCDELRTDRTTSVSLALVSAKDGAVSVPLAHRVERAGRKPGQRRAP